MYSMNHGAFKIILAKCFISVHAKKPPICLEYILVHELVHSYERNNNDRFVCLMDKFKLKWRLHRDELNKLPIVHKDWGY